MRRCGDLPLPLGATWRNLAGRAHPEVPQQAFKRVAVPAFITDDTPP